MIQYISLNRFLFVILILIIFYSCNENKKVEISYLHGKLYKKKFISDDDKIDSIYTYYGEDGLIKLKELIISKNKTKFIEYHKNGNKSIEGYTFNNKFFDKISFYDKDQHLIKLLDYKIICNQSYLNQVILYNKNKIIEQSSNYLKVLVSNNQVSINESLSIKFLYAKAFNLNSKISLFIGDEVDSSFCDVKDKTSLFCSTNGNSLISKISFSSKGYKILRGYIEEKNEKDVTVYYRKVYFEILIKVRS